MSGHWQRLLAPRDRELADAGAEGELLVARARLAMTAVILIVPLMILVEDPARQENWIGLAAGTITVLVSAAVLVAVSRRFSSLGHRTWR
jgi:NO-binding membrane sensor protein with MHYT domain